jgi:hypothetical protein
MSLIVTVYTSEGIVMASDSRASFSSTESESEKKVIVHSGHYFDTVDKLFLAPNKCGISTCGDGRVNNLPVSSIINTFIRTMVKKEDNISKTAKGLFDYIKNLNPSSDLTFHICGYELNEKQINSMIVYGIYTKMDKIEKLLTDFPGAAWNGATEVLARILLKSYFLRDEKILPSNTQISFPNSTENNFSSIKLDRETVLVETKNVSINNNLNIPWEFLTVQDGIDFAEYAIKTTIDTMKFAVINKTVGGPIDILVITPDNAEWVRKKKSY